MESTQSNAHNCKAHFKTHTLHIHLNIKKTHTHNTHKIIHTNTYNEQMNKRCVFMTATNIFLKEKKTSNL